MSTKSMLKVMGLMVVVIAMLGMAGCKHKKPLNTGFETGAGAGASSGSGFGGNSDGSSTGLPGFNQDITNFEPGGKYGLETIHFDYDSSAIRSDAMTTLQSNAQNIKKVPGAMFQIAGHCDSRGTQEYNLALGERRALAVRTYLMQLGIPGERLTTISYGAESPADPGNGESAWAQNRRAEFNVSK
jgi:peptidoglycan-associated lipoprotein